MSVKLSAVALALAASGVLLVASLAVSNRLLSASAIAEPGATNAKIVKLAFSAPYQIASPHRSLVKSAWNSLFPIAHAVECDCTEGKPNTQGCHCPNCINDVCTQYTCQFTGNTTKACALDPNGWKYAPTRCQVGCPPTYHTIGCTAPPPDPGCTGGICR